MYVCADGCGQHNGSSAGMHSTSSETLMTLSAISCQGAYRALIEHRDTVGRLSNMNKYVFGATAKWAPGKAGISGIS